METNNQNANVNNNNVIVNVVIDQPKKKVIKKKPAQSPYKKWILGIVASLIVVAVSTFIKTGVTSFFRNDSEKKIINALNAYAGAVNENKFDAYKYFSSKVDRFYQMKHTTPKDINDYVNGLYQEQYKNDNTRFDESTMDTEVKENGDYKVSVIMYSTCFKVEEQKQYNDYRSRIELVLDKNFKIKFFRQFYD